MVGTMNISNKVKAGVVGVALIMGSLVYQWYKTPELPSGSVVVAPVAEVVKDVPKEEVHPKKLVVYKKADVTKKVRLPAEVEADPAKQITSVSDVAPSKAGVTVTTVVDTESGETVAYQEIKKQPLFGFGGETRVGVGYGVVGRDREANVHVDYTFGRVGNFYGSIRGEGNERGDLRGTINLDYVWGN